MVQLSWPQAIIDQRLHLCGDVNIMIMARSSWDSFSNCLHAIIAHQLKHVISMSHCLQALLPIFWRLACRPNLCSLFNDYFLVFISLCSLLTIISLFSFPILFSNINLIKFLTFRIIIFNLTFTILPKVS